MTRYVPSFLSFHAKVLNALPYPWILLCKGNVLLCSACKYSEVLCYHSSSPLQLVISGLRVELRPLPLELVFSSVDVNSLIDEARVFRPQNEILCIPASIRARGFGFCLCWSLCTPAFHTDQS